VWKISPPPGFDPRTVQPVASRYTACDIPTHMYSGTISSKFRPFLPSRCRQPAQSWNSRKYRPHDRWRHIPEGSVLHPTPIGDVLHIPDVAALIIDLHSQQCIAIFLGLSTIYFGTVRSQHNDCSGDGRPRIRGSIPGRGRTFLFPLIKSISILYSTSFDQWLPAAFPSG
jgi:hypothetical protein